MIAAVYQILGSVLEFDKRACGWFGVEGFATTYEERLGMGYFTGVVHLVGRVDRWDGG